MTNKFKMNYAYAALAVVALGGLAGCNDGGLFGGGTPSASNETPADKAVADIQNVVVIYAENRSFDNLYSDFPGLDNPLANPTTNIYPQKDRDGATSLARLPKIPGGLTVSAAQQFDAGVAPVTEATTDATFASLGAGFYSINDTFGTGLNAVTHDMYHRFYENQMQIDGGKNDMFAAWADSGGMVMGLFTSAQAQALPLRAVARKYTLADHWFQGAFGGSYLNHQYLIASAPPVNVSSDPNHPPLSVLADGQNPQTGYILKQQPASPASAIDGIPTFVASTNTTPDGYSVNTMQPAYQPSSNLPPNGASASATDALLGDPAAATTLPPQTQDTIGTYLSAANVSWAYYSGGWGTMSAACEVARAATCSDYNYTAAYQADGVTPRLNFQFHHQPFNYYKAFDPTTTSGAANRTAHLWDAGDAGEKLIADIDAGKLPAVSFYKPVGDLNEHPGYTDTLRGDQHIANLISHLEKSPQWKHMLVIVTYDENGGIWDHVAPPKGDRFGPGSRIPALIIGPNVKKGYVDHTMYDTTSVLRFITRRWSLPTLPGLQQRIDGLKANNGGVPQGDLSNALLVSGL